MTARKPEEFLTPQELADRWRLQVKTIYNRLHLDQVPNFYRCGGRILFPLADVKEYEEKYMNGGQ